MKQKLALERSDVIAILARYGDRAPEEVGERVGSLELAWLIQALEDQTGTQLDLDDERTARMTTVDAVVEVLHELAAGVA